MAAWQPRRPDDDDSEATYAWGTTEDAWEFDGLWDDAARLYEFQVDDPANSEDYEVDEETKGGSLAEEEG
jgi:hypothetical protein